MTSSENKRRSPYQGLIPYSEADAPYFFGREKETRLIIANLFGCPLTILYGASGVGKSSVLRAGVAHQLRERDDLIVVVFNAWQGNPVSDLKQAVADYADLADHAAWKKAVSLLPQNRPASLSEFLAITAAQLNRRLMIILDQFEEYFLYHPQEDEFAAEFCKAVTQTKAPVSFMISIREDFYAKLDRFEGRIPALYDNYLRIEHLNRTAARVAIEAPIAQYNQLNAANDQQISIEPELVDAVLRQVETGRVVLGEAGRGVIEAGTAEKEVEAQIETPFLQLVMTRLWEEEASAQSTRLKRTTLDSLGGAESIVRTHLDAVLGELTPPEQEIAASIFHYLVTPSGTKIAYNASDLAGSAELNAEKVVRVLEKLSHSDERILRTVEPLPDRPTTPRYEIFHDVLAPAILTWRTGYVQTQDRAAAELQLAQIRQRARRLRLGIAVLGLLLLAMTGLTVFAFQQRDAAKRAQEEALRQQALAQAALQQAEDATEKLKQETKRVEEQKDRAEQALTTAQQAEAVALEQRNVAEQAQASAEVSAHAAELAAARAEAEQKVAFSRFLTARALTNLDDHLDTALLLGVEASRLANISEAQGALLEALEHNPKLSGFISGHTGRVTSVALSPDGKILASGSADRTVRLWALATQEKVALFNDSSAVNTIAFHPDGKLLASGNEDGTITLWDVVSGQPNGERLTGKGERISSVVFSPDGKLLASSSINETLLWDVTTRQPIGQLPGHGDLSGWHKQMAFSPDGKILVPPGKSVTLWDVASRKPLGPPLPGSVESVAFSPDGKILAKSEWGKDQIELLDIATLKPIGKPLKLSSGFLNTSTNLAFSGDGKLLAADRTDGGLVLWEVATGQEFANPLSGRKADIGGITFTADEKIAAASGDEIILWDLKAESRLGEALTDNNSIVNAAAVSPDGRILAANTKNNTITLWELESGRHIARTLTGHTNPVRSVAFSPSGRMLASGSADREIILWDVATGRAMGQPLIGPSGDMIEVAFLPDGETLIANNRTRNRTQAGFADTFDVISVWDVTSHKLKLPILECRGDFMNVTAWSPDHRRFAKAQSDGSVVLWDVIAQKQQSSKLSGHTQRIDEMIFSPDGRILASAGGNENKLILWNVESGQPIGDPLTKHDLFGTTLAFSPNGKVLAAASEADIVLWDVASRREIGQPLSVESDVTALAFSPDGEILVSNGQNGTVILWDVAARQVIGQPLTHHKAKIETLLFTQNGHGLIVGSTDERSDQVTSKPTLRFWTLAVPSLQSRACSLVNRNLNRDEWKKYFGDMPYHKTCPTLPVHYSFANDGQELAVRIENFLLNFVTNEAVATYREMQRLNLTAAISADLHNSLCWEGSLNGYVNEVMSACNQAVALQPKNGAYRDSRGVARALSGDIKGAIEDFQAYIEWSDDEPLKKQRQQWVDALRVGKNPFPKELEKLRVQ